jgi:hypothetical protein
MTTYRAHNLITVGMAPAETTHTRSPQSPPCSQRYPVPKRAKAAELGCVRETSHHWSRWDSGNQVLVEDIPDLVLVHQGPTKKTDGQGRG